MHRELAAAGEGALIFACRLACEDPMRLAVCLGYDGPEGENCTLPCNFQVLRFQRLDRADLTPELLG